MLYSATPFHLVSSCIYRCGIYMRNFHDQLAVHHLMSYSVLHIQGSQFVGDPSSVGVWLWNDPKEKKSHKCAQWHPEGTNQCSDMFGGAGRSMCKKSNLNARCGTEQLPRGTKCRAGCRTRIPDLQDETVGPRSTQSAV